MILFKCIIVTFSLATNLLLNLVGQQLYILLAIFPLFKMVSKPFVDQCIQFINTHIH